MPPRNNLMFAAVSLQDRIHELGEYGHVTVTARGSQLHVRVDGEIIVRVEQTGSAHYALAFRNHSGQWEPMPVQGTLTEVATGVVEMLGPYLCR